MWCDECDASMKMFEAIGLLHRPPCLKTSFETRNNMTFTSSMIWRSQTASLAFTADYHELLRFRSGGARAGEGFVTADPAFDPPRLRGAGTMADPLRSSVPPGGGRPNQGEPKYLKTSNENMSRFIHSILFLNPIPRNSDMRNMKISPSNSLYRGFTP